MLDRTVGLYPESNAGTDVSTDGPRVGKTKATFGTRTWRAALSSQLSLGRGTYYVLAGLRITQAVQVVLEKRLGIAQLCLLLAVLLFIGLTRGASAQYSPPAMHRSTRAWGVRNLSFGSNADGWNPLRRRSRSPAEEIENIKAEKATGNYNVLIREAFH